MSTSYNGKMNKKNENCLMRCSNNACALHEYHIVYRDDKCGVCGADMVPWQEKHWLIEIADDENLWVDGANEKYPCIIAFEYKRLRDFCRKPDVFGTILCLKDNFEALLKFETLIAYAWAAGKADPDFEKNKISLITTPNPSMGTWNDLAKKLINNLKEIGKDLPVGIPLEKITKVFSDDRIGIVNWRNKEIGHGLTRFEEDKELREELTEKIKVLKELMLSI
ncbi:MAG: hypothetical protein K6G30_01145, partial [Acetatifactor sp.]|nr:hypothetical protein [Acetatifactor sp.]